MAHIDSVLPSVWKEVSRHLEIGESTALIAGLLKEFLPLREVLVLEFDVPRRRASTVAAGFSHNGWPASFNPVDLDSDPFRKLLSWCRKGEPRSGSEKEKNPPLYSVLVPESAHGRRIYSWPASRFSARPWRFSHLRSGPLAPGVSDLIKDLLEPFTVALLNEHRLLELAKLRETAEADKQTLLHRLGRDQMDVPIIGAQEGLRHVMQRVALVAGADVPVLILGETGAGKEVISRAIHSGSPRTAGPFIRVNCGAIPPELVDSHLFGHEPGSFTGATEQRKGWFERAGGGTLFLDEIGELPLPAQVRLLRVLQDGHIERVGGQEPIHVDVRLVAATHRDLAQMVREGRFCEDLWYRIAVFPILLPPLRERVADISSLADHFARRAAVRFGLPLQLPSAQDADLLKNYSWPGNVRELAAVIDRAALLGNGAVFSSLRRSGASGHLRPSQCKKIFLRKIFLPPAQIQNPRLAPLNQAMRAHIENALAATLGKVEGPASARRF